MENIIWKKIEDYPNYSISNNGQLRNDIKDKIVNQSTDAGGYKVVSLSNNNIRKTKKVHRLVAQAFISNPDNLPQVDHIDRNRQNNSVDNLRWATCHRNMQNQSSHRDSNSNYVGVHWCKPMNKWKAGITINSKTKHLGYFTNETDASQAYQAAKLI